VKTPPSREGKGKGAMKSPTPHQHDEEDDDGEVFLDESDIVHELPIDEEGPSSSLSLALLVNMYSCVCVLWTQIFLMQKKTKPALMPMFTVCHPASIHPYPILFI
jgi:hypothetical protein